MEKFLFLLVGAVLLLAAFGLLDNLWNWAKSLFSKTGGTVPTTIDAAINGWLTTAKSVKVQGLLRLARLEYSALNDTEAVASIDALIAKAAAWDDQKVSQ